MLKSQALSNAGVTNYLWTSTATEAQRTVLKDFFNTEAADSNDEPTFDVTKARSPNGADFRLGPVFAQGPREITLYEGDTLRL